MNRPSRGTRTHSFLGYHHKSQSSALLLDFEQIGKRKKYKYKVDTVDAIFSTLVGLIIHVKIYSRVYQELDPSPYDPYVGKWQTDLKKYKRTLVKETKIFLWENRSFIKKNKLKGKIKEIISQAKRYQGEFGHDVDPNARPGWNHHTFKPYY